jgi:pyruvate formate lyase activating enzyme
MQDAIYEAAATTSTRGVVFDIKRYALHDGPGIRTTVFFKGCPLRCWWCHNPESQAASLELMFQKNRCTGCGDCLAACEEGALSLADGELLIARDRCTRCGACALACQAEALMMSGREMTVAEVLAEIERDSLFYDESGGGVTFSGGEPLMQPEFLAELLRACRARGLHTALDTSGYAPWPTLEGISGDVSLFLYDLKLMDDRKHRRFTGVSNELILANLRELASRGAKIVVRFPFIPGINDDPENIRSIGEFVASLPCPCPINVLPYHRAGIAKYAKLGRAYPLAEIEPPTAERLGEVAAALAEFGLEVLIGGELHGRRCQG